MPLVTTIVSVWLFTTPITALPAEPEFGTCQWWTHITALAGSTTTSQALHSGIRLGFAQGIMTGLMTDPFGSYVSLLDFNRGPNGGPGKYWMEGVANFGERPAILTKAFDERCGDFRNERLMLAQVAMVAIFEIGGLPRASGDRVIELFRARTPESEKAALSMLIAATGGD